jgi:hypothetical protein
MTHPKEYEEQVKTGKGKCLIKIYNNLIFGEMDVSLGMRK